MSTAKEGRSTPRNSRWGIVIWLGIGLAYFSGLTFYKTHALRQVAQDQLQVLKTREQVFRNLFQANFYFYFQEQFIPGLKREIEKYPDLKGVQYVSSEGQLLYDSKDLDVRLDGKSKVSAEVMQTLSRPEPTVRTRGFEVLITVPSGAFSVLYTFEASELKRQIWMAVILGAVIFLLLFMLRAWADSNEVDLQPKQWVQQLFGLRTKFFITIFAVNAMTGLIVFTTLSELQTREETQKIEKEALLFGQFSNHKLVTDFTNYFYFYYQDKFLPSVKSLIAANENLVGIRVISNRTRSVLFDSETASNSPIPEAREEVTKVAFTDDQESVLKSRGMLSRTIERKGSKIFSVVTAYQNESQETLFLVEYTFDYQSLNRSLAQIRKQIIKDLIPALFIGLIIAIFFSQLLISPIRKLVMALRKVTEGDYEVRVDIERSDEIGELVQAFNGMTEELFKKKELRKYLSDSTYRQIMEAPVGSDGPRMGGSRVKATILFSDIRNFVKHCDEMEAEEVTSMLTEYFSNMVEVVYKHNGEVDKFIGDAILAVFYDADDKSGKVEGLRKEIPGTTSLQAIYCALEMRERLAEFNKKRQSMGKAVIDIGVGITHGEIISGPIGSKDRMDFTVIGDVVNLASRIEKVSKTGRYSHIVFSEEVELKVRGLLIYEEMDHQVIQGLDEPVRVYELKQIRELKEILVNLSSKDADLRARSVELLGYSRNTEAIPFILKAIDDSEEIVRIQSVLSLSRLAQPNDPVILEKIFKVLDKEKSKRVISALVTALGTLSTTEQILKIARFLNDEDERVVANVVESLGKVGTPQCLDLVSARLSSRNNRVKANAAMALFSAGHVEVIDMLKPMLLHSDPLMRSSAAFAIGELTLLAHQDKLLDLWKKRGKDVNYFLGEIQASVPMLVALLRDPEAIVKRQALIGLGKIKDRSSVLPIIDMIELDKNSKDLIKEASQALWSIGSHKMIREVLNRLV